MTFKRALSQCIFWLALALAAWLWIYLNFNFELSNQFLAGYVAELSLSLDNVFLFVILFKFFNLNEQQESRILKYGLIGAGVLRLLFILLGITVLSHFHWIVYVLGSILLYTAYRLSVKGSHSSDFNPETFIAVKLMKGFFPVSHEKGVQTFFITKDRVFYVTELFIALVTIESLDVLFAVDSIPAVLAVTSNPYIAFASNLFAIIGLRSLYFLVRNKSGEDVGLSYSMIAILAFMGLKLVLSHWIVLGTGATLSIIIGLLVSGFIFHRLKRPPLS
jgi:tellurite resistance protein TerC